VTAKDRYGWEFGLWLLGFFLCFGGAVAAFGRVAPWPSAIPTAQAVARWPGQIDPSWPAVVSSHGRPKEWPLGTVADNPAAFAAWVAALVASVAGVWFCFRRLKRHEALTELSASDSVCDSGFGGA
jgi:hypothetical protein